MSTPSAALAWEFWSRHRKRLSWVAGIILFFAVVYPFLCASAGLDLTGRDALDGIAKMFDAKSRPISISDVIRILYFVMLACGPTAAMFVTLLLLVWMFTFTAPDPKTKDPMTFPGRLFTLPVSTTFLFGWLLLSGQAAIFVFYNGWVRLVRMPHLEMFDAYQHCWAWMTIMALAQGIVWSLAAWPVSRMLLLLTLLFCFASSPANPIFVDSLWVLLPFFLLGVLLARVGLQKMRHGQWQGVNWEKTISFCTDWMDWQPKRFASPAQAQLWFEWRRFARRLCLFVAGLTVLPVLIHVLVRFAAGWGPLENETMCAFVGALLFVPLFFHWTFVLPSVQPPDLAFTMVRPLTNGQIMMATLKGAAVSTVISCVLVLASIGGLSLLGNLHAVEKAWEIPPQAGILVILPLMFLSWRLIASNLCFAWSGHSRLDKLPLWMIFGLYALAGGLSLLSQYENYWNAFCVFLPALLVCLLVVKVSLAVVAFRLSVKRRLLAPSACAAYLVVWPLLAAALLAPMVILFHGQPGVATACLGIVLLTPLSRIGFCPIALSWSRHT